MTQKEGQKTNGESPDKEADDDRANGQNGHKTLAQVTLWSSSQKTTMIDQHDQSFLTLVPRASTLACDIRGLHAVAALRPSIWAILVILLGGSVRCCCGVVHCGRKSNVRAYLSVHFLLADMGFLARTHNNTLIWLQLLLLLVGTLCSSSWWPLSCH